MEYKLIKDLPNIKAGAIFLWHEPLHSYVYVEEHGVLTFYTKEEILNKDFFKEIHE